MIILINFYGFLFRKIENSKKHPHLKFLGHKKTYSYIYIVCEVQMCALENIIVNNNLFLFGSRSLGFLVMSEPECKPPIFSAL